MLIGDYFDEIDAAFDVDVLACPACGGRLRLIALVLDPRTIHAMLLSLRVPPEDI